MYIFIYDPERDEKEIMYLMEGCIINPSSLYTGPLVISCERLESLMVITLVISACKIDASMVCNLIGFVTSKVIWIWCMFCFVGTMEGKSS